MRRLDPIAIAFRRDGGGRLAAELEDRCILRVNLTLPFPLSAYDGWLSVGDAEGREIGLLPGVEALDPESRRIVEEELHLRYFTPRVTAILGMRDELQGGRSGGVVWSLQTDRGPAVLHMPNTNEHIQPLPGGRMLLTDRAGNRYEIANVAELDAASRRRLSRYVWL